MTDFRHNHYVPRWYQERFLPLVGAVMAVVVLVGDGELEISYPGGQREIIHD